MSSLTDTLTALGSRDPSVRVPAEQAVTQAKDADLANFIIAVLGELRDETKPAFSRLMAGTLLKNSVAPSFREVAARRQLEEKWKQLPPSIRAQVKNEVLSTLASPNRDVRAVAANIIGSLSRIELPAGEWPDLIRILVSSVNAAPQQQEAALTALGYVCEEGRDSPEVEKALSSSTSDILTVIVQCMGSPDEDVTYAATRALCNAMEFIHETMEQPEQRHVLVNTLCTTAKSAPTARTRECAMECLVKVVELYYSTLPDYISQLHLITTSMIFDDEESVSLQALQFWISICETELLMKEEDEMDKCFGYAREGVAFLVENSLKLLLMQEEEQDEEDWNRSIAGGKLLQSLSEVVGTPVIAPVMSFVYANINVADDWRKREAALMAFGCILSVDSPDALQDTVAQAVPGLLQYLHDSHSMVANTCGWVTSVVCENFSAAFLEQPQFLQQLLNSTSVLIRGDDDSMAKRGCQILHNLALAYEDDETADTNALSHYFGDILDVLLEVICRHQSSPDTKSAAGEALSAMVDAAAQDVVTMLHRLVPLLQEQLRAQLLEIASNYSAERETMAGLLCGALACISRKLDNAFEPYLNSTMQLLVEILNIKQDFIQHEAFVAIGSIAHAAKSRMAAYLGHIIPYIVQELQNFDEPDKFGSVVGTIGDLCLACKDTMMPFAAVIMNTLYSNLMNPLVDRDIKVCLISCLRDMILSVLGGEGFAPYSEQVMNLMGEMFAASRAIDIRGDPDGEEYVMSLWEATAGLYSSIIQCYQANNVNKLIPFLPPMLEFALEVASKSTEYPESMLAAILIIGDMASVLKSANQQLCQQAKHALLIPAVDQALAACGKVCSPDDKKQLKWVQDQLRLLQKC